MSGRPSANSAIIKRSLVVRGHSTSVSLEDAFWSALKEIASARSVSLPELVADIDDGRDSANLSSAIRVYVLQTCRSVRAD